MGRMSGKVAVITGASSGIGKATAILFAKEGASVVIAARRANLLSQVAEQIATDGSEVLCVPTDISDAKAVKALMNAAVEKYGRIDALVNVAGVSHAGLLPIDRFTDEGLEFELSINTKGTMNCMREATSIMIKQESLCSVVSVGSVAGVVGTSCASHSASTGAIVAATKNAAIRFTGTNVRVNCVCPGGVVTPMMEDTGVPADPDMMGALGRHCDFTPGYSEAIDVANLLLFLSCDESKILNGQIIVCDKGTNL